MWDFRDPDPAQPSVFVINARDSYLLRGHEHIDLRDFESISGRRRVAPATIAKRRKANKAAGRARRVK